MATKKVMTQKELDDAETKVMALLINEESDPIELQGGVKVRFKRPNLTGKYRYQLWLTKKLAEIGLDASDEDNSEYLLYWNAFGLINIHTTELVLKDGTLYEYNQKEDTDYKFLFEKYVVEELYSKNVDETDFVLDAINKFFAWQSQSNMEPEELKNS